MERPAIRIIKPVNHKDEAVAYHLWTVFQDSYKAEASLLGLDCFPPLDRSAASIQDSDSFFWCYGWKNHFAGVIEVEDELDSLTICSLAVQPAFFRQGIASALVSHVLLLATGRRVKVQTATLNQPAISLYRKFDFTEKSIWKSTEGIELISLEKSSTTGVPT